MKRSVAQINSLQDACGALSVLLSSYSLSRLLVFYALLSGGKQSAVRTSLAARPGREQLAKVTMVSGDKSQNATTSYLQSGGDQIPSHKRSRRQRDAEEAALEAAPQAAVFLEVAEHLQQKGDRPSITAFARSSSRATVKDNVSDINQDFTLADKDANGLISFKEARDAGISQQIFAMAGTGLREELNSDEFANALAFASFDEDDNNKLHKAEASKAGVADMCFSVADSDHDAMLDFYEFTDAKMYGAAVQNCSGLVGQIRARQQGISRRVFAYADVNATGTLGFEKFTHAETFSKFDFNRNGALELAEAEAAGVASAQSFAAICHNSSEGMTFEEFEKALSTTRQRRRAMAEVQGAVFQMEYFTQRTSYLELLVLWIAISYCFRYVLFDRSSSVWSSCFAAKKSGAHKGLVMSRLTLQGVAFQPLSDNPALRRALKANLKRAVVESVGLGLQLRNVEVVFKPSCGESCVHADVQIMTPPGVDVKSLLIVLGRVSYFGPDGELWRCQPLHSVLPIQLQTEPRNGSVSTGATLGCGEYFVVSDIQAETTNGDELQFLRLADGRGWLPESTVSGSLICKRIEGTTVRNPLATTATKFLADMPKSNSETSSGVYSISVVDVQPPALAEHATRGFPEYVTQFEVKAI